MGSIRREPPSQRRHYRLTAPLWVELEGQEYRASDWSLGGVKLTECRADVRVGDVRPARVRVPFEEFHIEFDQDVRIVRHDPERGDVGCEFQGLGPRQEEVLKYFAQGLLSGEMAVVEDAIERISIPVTPVPESGEAHPADRVHRARALRRAGIAVLYVVAGALLLGYIGLTLYTFLFRLQIESAVVSAPMEAVQSPTHGLLDRVLAPQGTLVQEGQPLFVIHNSRVAESVELARIRVEEARLELERQDSLLLAQRMRLAIYGQIGLSRIEEARGKVASLARQLRVAQETVVNAEWLQANGAVSRSRVEALKGERDKARENLSAAKDELKIAEDSLRAIQKGVFFTGNELEGSAPELEVAVSTARERLTLEGQKLAAAQSEKDGLTVKTPFQGWLVKALKSAGNAVDHGDPVVLLERMEGKVVEAYLTQSEVVRVGLGREAMIFLPSLATRIQGEVVRIDRTSGFVDEVQARFKWRGPEDRSALVVLGFRGPDANRLASQLPAGLPAVVLFDREPVNELFQRVFDVFRVGEKGRG